MSSSPPCSRGPLPWPQFALGNMESVCQQLGLPGVGSEAADPTGLLQAVSPWPMEEGGGAVAGTAEKSRLVALWIPPAGGLTASLFVWQAGS